MRTCSLAAAAVLVFGGMAWGQLTGGIRGPGPVEDVPQPIQLGEPVKTGAGVINGAVIDAGGKMAYLEGVKGIEAVNLADGKTLWRTEGLERPLIAADSGLVVMETAKDGNDSQFRVAVLGKADGKKGTETEAIDLAPWVHVAGAAGQMLNWTCAIEGKGAEAVLVMKWWAHYRKTGGAFLPGRQQTRGASGEIRVKLADGAVEKKTDEKPQWVAVVTPQQIEVGGLKVTVTETAETADRPGSGLIRRKLTCLQGDKTLWQKDLRDRMDWVRVGMLIP